MDSGSLQISYSLDKIDAVANQLWQWANHCKILCFSGEMGAGKTTFIHALCTRLGVEDPISSPTFALINEYRFSQNGRDTIIYHMDWYRLRNADEAINAGLEDAMLQPGTYCFIEWAEKARAILPHPHLWIRLESLSEAERMLTATLHS